MSLEAASISDERRSSLPEAALLLDGLERDLGAEILSAASQHLLAVDVGANRRLVFVADEQMGYVAVNARACELLGYEREELLAMRVPDIAVAPSAAAEYGEMVAAGARVGVAPIRAKDGRLFDLSYSASEIQVRGRRLFVSVGLVDAADERAGPAAVPTKRVRLLFADDDAPTRLLMRTLLGFVDDVDVVGEAEDGETVVRLAGKLRPDVVLLDAHMRRLDGLAAAEAIRALYPSTQIVLHTAQPDEQLRSRAAQLGLPLLDTMRFDDVLAVLEPEPQPRLTLLPDPRIEAAVLTALSSHGGKTATLVVSPDGSVPFYNLAAAELLGLPLPARRSHIDILRQYYQVLRPDGTPVPTRERPLYQAIRAQQPVTEIVLVSHGDTRTAARSAVAPFFFNDGSFAGATLYFEPL
jgi:PAS domain S-box-containing protein